MMRLFLAVMLCALPLLSGCGFLFGDDGVFRDKSQDYKRAPETPVVQVPEDKDSAALRELYVVPPVQEDLVLAGEFEVPRPTPLVGGSGAEVVRIQKLGEQSWALVELAPGQVWPQVRSFLAAAGMQVARADARAGIIDTGWLRLEGKPMESRFRFRMDQGVQRATSELHVLQMNRAGDVENWPQASDDPDQAHEMLRAVAQFLADTADSSPVSMIAQQGISSSGKISLQESAQGYTYINLGLPFDRAWASLARALEKSTFEITDRDRSAGVYYTRFLGPEDAEEEGWFDWLWGDEEHPLAGERFVVTMEAVDAQTVSIRLRPEDASRALEKREAQAMLSLIKGNID